VILVIHANLPHDFKRLPILRRLVNALQWALEATVDPECPIPFGNLAEFSLLYLLWTHEHVFYTYSVALDRFFATDALVTGLEKRRGMPAIAVQITLQRRASGKASDFVAKASKKFPGPLLYLRIDGKVTLNMATAFREALVSLWDDPARKLRRAHGVVVRSDGTKRWFRITQPEEARRRRRRKRI
jgi:hypothetical protein